jgi:hypothetical protein
MRTKKVLGTAVVAVCAVFAGAAAANEACRPLNGYTGEGKGSADVTTTWGAITAATGYYFSAGAVKGSCEVKDQRFDGKGPPRFDLYPVGAKGMNRDQCSMYKTSANVLSKLREGDNANAYLASLEIATHADALLAANKIEANAGAAISKAAAATADCIKLLLPAM